MFSISENPSILLKNFFQYTFLFLEHLSFWTSGRWILRLWALSTHTWKKGSGTPDFKLTAAIFFQWSWINNRWHIMCDLKGLCNTVSAGERLLCPKSSHQVLWNNTTSLAAATWEQHHSTRCGTNIRMSKSTLSYTNAQTWHGAV